MIRVEQLRKHYGKVRAVDGVSFEVRPGEIYGLLGPNGAGKTTTLSILSGLLSPDEGRILFDGVELSSAPPSIRQQLGVVPQETALYDQLTARQNLRFWAGLYGLSGRHLQRQVDQTLDRVGLSARADAPVRGYSGGMKRRLNLGLGLVHDPRVLLLDEPTVGIDPQARVKILDLVRETAAAGTTVLYTTHYLEEAERLCERIGIMDHGKLLVEGTLAELKTLVGEEETIVIRGSFDIVEAADRLSRQEGVRMLSSEPGRLALAVAGGGRRAVDLLSRVLDGRLAVDGVSVEPPNLNGLFLKLTGRELRD